MIIVIQVAVGVILGFFVYDAFIYDFAEQIAHRVKNQIGKKLDTIEKGKKTSKRTIGFKTDVTIK